MRKLLFSLLALTMLATSCEKDVETITPTTSDVEVTKVLDKPTLQTPDTEVESASTVFQGMLSWSNSTSSGQFEVVCAPILMPQGSTASTMYITFFDVPAFGGGFDSRTEGWDWISTTPHTNRQGVSGQLSKYEVVAHGSGLRWIFKPNNSPVGFFQMTNYPNVGVVDLQF